MRIIGDAVGRVLVRADVDAEHARAARAARSAGQRRVEPAVVEAHAVDHRAVLDQPEQPRAADCPAAAAASACRPRRSRSRAPNSPAIASRVLVEARPPARPGWRSRARRPSSRSRGSPLPARTARRARPRPPARDRQRGARVRRRARTGRGEQRNRHHRARHRIARALRQRRRIHAIRADRADRLKSSDATRGLPSLTDGRSPEGPGQHRPGPFFRPGRFRLAGPLCHVAGRVDRCPCERRGATHGGHRAGLCGAGRGPAAVRHALLSASARDVPQFEDVERADHAQLRFRLIAGRRPTTTFADGTRAGAPRRSCRRPDQRRGRATRVDGPVAVFGMGLTAGGLGGADRHRRVERCVNRVIDAADLFGAESRRRRRRAARAARPLDGDGRRSSSRSCCDALIGAATPRRSRFVRAVDDWLAGGAVARCRGAGRARPACRAARSSGAATRSTARRPSCSRANTARCAPRSRWRSGERARRRCSRDGFYDQSPHDPRDQAVHRPHPAPDARRPGMLAQLTIAQRTRARRAGAARSSAIPESRLTRRACSAHHANRTRFDPI